MNNDIKKYLKDIKNFFPLMEKDEKVYFTKIKNDILKNTDSCSTYNDCLERFGDPKDFIISYYEDIETNIFLKKLKRKKYIKRLIAIITIFLLTIWIFEIYRLNQLYKEGSSQLNGCYEETIQEN